uniref:Mannosyltransferase n=1 Tax=Arundo donax TaxID=35708 RepID=A0A0A8YVX2_ARUDO
MEDSFKGSSERSWSISLLESIKYCVITAIICIGFTVLVDSIMWRRILWPEFEVLWFNSVLNRSSEWGVSFMLL